MDSPYIAYTGISQKANLQNQYSFHYAILDNLRNLLNTGN